MSTRENPAMAFHHLDRHTLRDRRFSAVLAIGALITLGLAVQVARAVPASPNSSGGTTGKTGHGFGWIDPSAGMYQDRIEVDVPGFHDLEPELTLSYGSGGGNGYVGVGWALGGFSIIERAGTSRGAPAYTSADVWLLDGVLLHRCEEPHAPSASCANGGTHFPEQESYERIRFVQTGSESVARWEITDREGVTTTYRPVQIAAAGTGVFRFAVTTVQDPNGNRVDYEWGTELLGGAWLYPRRIVYRTGRVDLHWEARPDIESYADGTALTVVRGRLKTIVVSSVDVTGTPRVQAAHRLRYGVGALTGRSLLSSIQEFGRDATLASDANGELDVIGGTSEPPTQLAYSGATSGDYGTVAVDGGLGVWCAVGSGNGSTGQLEYAGDFDGDGRQDLGCRAAGIHYIAYSRADATAGATGFVDGGPKLSGLCTGPWDRDQQLNADYDGDGMTDLGCSSGGSLRIARSTGDGFGAIEEWASGWCASVDDRGFGGDFNGDGAADIACRSGTTVTIRLSTRTTFAPALSVQGWCAAPGHQLTGDFNGDGRTDLACRTASTNGGGAISVLLSAETGFVPAAAWHPGWCQQGDGTGMSDTGAPTEYLFTGDFNGDGKDDLGCRRTDGRQYVALSTGRTFVADLAPWDTTPALCPNGASGGRTYVFVNGQIVESIYAFQYPSDFNADGRTDIACRTGGLIHVALSTGRGFTSPIALQAGCVNGTESGTGNFPLMLVGDFDGDGRTDAACRQTDGRHTVSLVSHPVPDLLTRRSNGYGGTVDVRYRVATSWPDTRGIRGMTVEAIVLSDGRTPPAETTFAYAGGRYDARHKTPLGFAVVRTTPPPIGSDTERGWTEATYHQTYALRGAPRTEEQRSGRGVLLARIETEHALEVEGQPLPPYRLLVVGKRAYEVFDGGDVRTCDAESTAYDEFGNVVIHADLGDCDAPNDDVTTHTVYVPNAAAYLVSLPAAVEVHLGATVVGPLLDETRTFYDGNVSHLLPPRVGQVSRSDTRRDETHWSVVRTEYDDRGNPVRIIDPLGAVTTTEYDALDRARKLINPLGHTVSTDFDAVCGLPASVTDANGGVTRTTYDALCRTALVEEPGGGFVRTQYVETGNPSRQHVLTETAPAHGVTGAAWTRSYSDGLGRVYRTLERGPSPAETITVDTKYDARGNVVAASNPYYWDGLSAVSRVWLETVYDQRGESTETRYAVDAPGGPAVVAGSRSIVSRWLRDTVTIDPMGHRTMERRDGQERVVMRGELLDRNDVAETLALRWLYTTYEYDGRGGLHRVTDPAGNVTTYDRDWDGRVVREVDPDRGVRTYTYDEKGRVVSSADALQQRTTIVYDVLDRPLERTIGTGRSKVVVHVFEYDDTITGGAAIGRLTRSSAGPDNAERYHYDVSGRIDRYEREIDGVRYALAYTYDIAGNVLRIAYPDGSFDTDAAGTTRVFDDAGRLRAVPGAVDRIVYDAANRPLIRTNANGTETRYTYDPVRGWLTALRTTLGSQVIQDELRDVDRDGLVRRIAIGPLSPSAHPGPTSGWTFDYNALHELLDARNDGLADRSDRFAYDDIGNLMVTRRNGSYVYPPSGPTSIRPHAVASMGKQRFKYDANGNMTRGRRLSIKYDGTRMPIKIRSTKYAYDVEGERFRARRGSRITRWVTNDYEIAPDGTVTKHVKLDENDDDGFSLVLKTVGSGPATRRYTLHTDEQGSIEVVTDEAGAVVHRREYGPWGDVQWESSAFRQERGYTGHYHDADTGLIYMRARYYDPTLARFLQADDVVDGDGLLGLNRYAYTHNDPTNLIDPDGHVVWWVPVVVGIAAKFVVDRIEDEMNEDINERYEHKVDFIKEHYDPDYLGSLYTPKQKNGSGLRKVVFDEVDKDFRPVGGRGGFIRNRYHFTLWKAQEIWRPLLKKFQGEKKGTATYNKIRGAVITERRLDLAGRRTKQAQSAKYAKHGMERARSAIRSAWGALRTRQTKAQGLRAVRALTAAKRAFQAKARKKKGTQCTSRRYGKRYCG